MSYTPGKQMVEGSWEETLWEIYSGLSIAFGHQVFFGKTFLVQAFPFLKLLGVGTGKNNDNNSLHGGADHHAGIHNTNNETNDDGVDVGQGLLKSSVGPSLSVVGVGYGRTGTFSLSLALTELGFPTLHTQHLHENEALMDMFVEKVFQPSIDAEEIQMGLPDFDLIVQHGFRATADLPMSLYFEELLRHNKKKNTNTKFILTTRESSDVWFASWDTLTRSIAQPARYGSYAGLSHMKKIDKYLRWLFSVVNKDPSYLTSPFPLPPQNREASIASYEAHNARVRALIPPDRLLEYNVKQGWEPLCEFLSVQPCPQTPFPKSNSRVSVQIQAIAATLLFYIIAASIIVSVVSFVVKQIPSTKGDAGSVSGVKSKYKSVWWSWSSVTGYLRLQVRRTDSINSNNSDKVTTTMKKKEKQKQT